MADSLKRISSGFDKEGNFGEWINALYEVSVGVVNMYGKRFQCHISKYPTEGYVIVMERNEHEVDIFSRRSLSPDEIMNAIRNFEEEKFKHEAKYNRS